METAFPRGGDRYVVVEDTDEQIMQRCIDECVRRKWTDVAKLYGVRLEKGKLVPSLCAVPHGYGTIKGKSWKKQVIVGRPLSPHTKHVMKRVSNSVARGYHVALLCGDGDVRVVRMFTTQEYMQRLASDQNLMLGELRKLTGDENVRLGMVWDV